MKDLPEDWFRLFGDKIIYEVADNLRRKRLDERLENQKSRHTPDIVILQDSTTTRPLTLNEARFFYNAPSICYCIKTTSESMRLGTSFPFWMLEAFEHWENCPDVPEGRNIDCDNKDPFGIIDIDRYRGKNWDGMDQWLGLGVDAIFGPESRGYKTVQEYDLSVLFAFHRQFCDLISKRIIQPLDDEEKDRLTWERRSRELRLRQIDPILSPLCRAVLIITRWSMIDTRNVLLVLTGDNSGLVGPAPSLDDIAQEGIIARRSSNVIEVSLQTAVEYLRRIDNREEEANAPLAAITEKRIAAQMSILHEEATQAVRECWEKCGPRRAVDIEELSDPRVREAVEDLKRWGELC